MVGRALHREVERELDPGGLRGGNHRIEVGVAPEVGMERVVATVCASDRPGAAEIALPRALGVVAALAVRRPDRVHGRQVDDVEAERGKLGQHGGDAAETSPGAREQLVPRAEPG